MNQWIIRDYTPDDEGGVTYMWLASYETSRFGKAHGAGFRDAYRPSVAHLLETQRVTLAVDKDAPEVIWGWQCASHDGTTLHYIVCKRAFHQAGASREIYASLLGDMLTRPIGYTHDLMDFRRIEVRDMFPKMWYPDFLWFRSHAA